MSHTDGPTPNWRAALAEFERLLSLEPAAQRGELDALQRSHPELYPQVQTLLKSHRQAEGGAFMATEIADRSSIGLPSESALQAGELIGQYRLERPLGEGGMGEVWLARRADGLFEVPVALKLMHLHLAQSSARDRFVREGRILGQLTHGNVSRLLDAGVLPGGQLYLALEYIAGQRIDRWCDEHRLDVHARVRLFLQVCEAVAHAHAHLVVHRDLKPSNILVTDDGVVKLLDFGIAKLVEDEQTQTPQSDLTQVGGRALTPDYAAPEQIEGAAITVATDVYTLGLILYGLLSGARPYRDVGRGSVRELERVILDVEPRAASAAVTTQHDAGDSAALRATTPRRLREALRGDLDTIIGKALKKSPKQRYPTVLALAGDLRAYLAEQPISARPDSLAYRSAKFARRHGLHTRRVRIIAGLAIIFGAVALTTLWHWQQREKQQALDQQALRARVALLYDNGRRELLAHNEARAAVYLNEAYKLGVDTPALRYMLARAMRVVDAQQRRIDTGAPLMTAQASPDGQHVFAVGSDHSLREYDRITGRLVFETRLAAEVDFNFELSAEYSPKGSLIWATSSQSDAPERRLRLFAADAAAPPVQLLPGVSNYGTTPTPIDSDDQTVAFIDHDGAIVLADRKGQQTSRIAGAFTSVGFCRDSDLLLAGTANGSLRILDRDGRLQRELLGLHGITVAQSSTPGCGIVAAGSDQGTVRAWDRLSGELLMSGGHQQAIGDLKLDDSGSRLMSLSRDSVAIWDPRSGTLIYSAKFRSHSQDLAQMRPDGQVLARLESGRLSVLDPVSGTDLYSLDGHIGAPATFAFDASNRRLLSGGADGALVLWNLPQRQLAEFTQGPISAAAAAQNDPPATAVSFSHDGHWLFAGGADGGGAIWDAKKRSRVAALEASGSPVSAVAFSPNDRWVAVGDWNQSLRILDRSSGKILRTQHDMGGRFFLLEFAATGRVIAGAMAGGLAKLWDAGNGQELASFQRDEARATALSPDGAAFAVGLNGVIRLWNIERRQDVWSTPLPPEAEARIGVVAFSRDGRRLLVTSMAQHAYLLDAADGRILQHASIPASTYFAVGGFDSKGAQIVLGDGSKSLALWRLRDGRLLRLEGHSGQLFAASFSADATLVLSSGEDGVVNIWDADNGDLLDSFAAQAGAVQWNYARFSPDWTQILTGGTDNRARLWDARREGRSAAEIEALLKCRVPWKTVGASLEPAVPDPRYCKAQ
ncbi:protein kinase domain-containing protein [Hydrocarboniphaga sp.]|uniref:protein kinase domain-containing protein n=1 Tax=Hydrocarboniphaga sp. TaxID=2033016 RepID=UPI003D099FA0